MASVSFPNNPSNGDTITSGGITYTYNATKGVWRDSATAVTSEVGGVTVYANTDILPLSGVDNGSLAHVTSTNRLYIWTGTGWYNIALINQTPTIQANSYSSSYTLDNTGANTVIELVASDPEELPITWTYTTTLTGNTASISQSNNVFTITPSTDSADGGTFSITFKASDGVNIGTATSSFTLAFVSPYWKDVALLSGTNDTNGLQNDSFVDRSTNGYTITSAGTPSQTSFHPHLDNWSVEFDGSGDLINFPSNDIILSGDFTISAWVYLRGSSRGQIIANRGPFGSADNRQVKIDANNRIGLYDGSSELTSTGTITRNKWHYIEVTRSGTTITFFIDGSSAGTATTASSFSFGSIGALWQTADLWNGYISNLRVTTSSISNSSVPTEKLTAITNTVLLTCQSNRFIDNSSSAHTLTPAGVVAIKSFNPFGQSSVYTPGENKGSVLLNGSTDYLLLGSGSATVPSDDFTAEAWVYITSSIASGTVFDFGSNSNYGIKVFWSHTSQHFRAYTTSGTVYIYNNNNTHSINQWHHVTVVRDSGMFKFYVNGVLQGTSTASVTFTQARFDAARIGITSHGYDPLTGYISDFRYNSTTALYTAVDETANVPTSPVGNTNASLYLPMDNAGIFDQTGNQTLTLVGDVQTSTTQTKYATTSMYFDGIGDMTHSVLPATLANQATIEFWSYSTSTSKRYIFDIGLYTGSSTLGIDTTGGTFALRGTTGGSGTTTLIVNGGAYSADTWYHIAIVKDGTTYELFVDGVSKGTGTYGTSNTYDNSYDFTIGAASTDGSTANYPWSGYIEDFQIINGQAKYTSNFTPPTASLSRSIQ